jgi:hypothetical protein
MLEIHNIYFMKKDFTEKQAKDWIIAHNYKLKKKDINKQHSSTEWRYNQIPKTKFKSFITKILPNGVHMIMGERIKSLKK